MQATKMAYKSMLKEEFQRKRDLRILLELESEMKKISKKLTDSDLCKEIYKKALFVGLEEDFKFLEGFGNLTNSERIELADNGLRVLKKSIKEKERGA